MKVEQIERVLEGVSEIRREGGTFLLPEDYELSFYVALPSELVTITRVTRVELQGDLTAFENHAGERYTVPTDSIAFMKNSLPTRRNRIPSPGFR